MPLDGFSASARQSRDDVGEEMEGASLSCMVAPMDGRIRSVDV